MYNYTHTYSHAHTNMFRGEGCGGKHRGSCITSHMRMSYVTQANDAIYIRTYTHIYIYIPMYIYIYIYLYMYIYIYIFTYTHTYICIYIYLYTHILIYCIYLAEWRIWREARQRLHHSWVHEPSGTFCAYLYATGKQTEENKSENWTQCRCVCVWCVFLWLWKRVWVCVGERQRGICVRCVLQCVAACCTMRCSVLQRVALSLSLTQEYAWDSVARIMMSMLQCVAVCCSVLQCVAVCCSVLQCVAVCCSALQCVVSVFLFRTCKGETHTATHCNALCNTLQHTATHACITCSALCYTLIYRDAYTLQHTATHCNTHMLYVDIQRRQQPQANAACILHMNK